MASDQRPSFSASSNSSTERRRPSSSSYHRSSSSSFRLPPLPPSTDSFASGTSILSPPPISPNFAALPPVPPPKDPQMTHPITPKRKPIERQKSPLSNEAYFSSPSSVMPGAFPTTPPTSSPSQNPNDMSSPTSKSPKRPSSVRDFLSFKALRRSYDNASLSFQGNRPSSAGVQSLPPTLRPSLNKKRSGTFWRRKSSLGMNFGEDPPASPSSTVTKSESVVEEERLMSPAPEENIPRLQKRKSLQLWKRKSNLTLNNAFAAMNGKENQPQPQDVGVNGGTITTTAATGSSINEAAQNGMTNGKHEGEDDVTMEDGDTERSLSESEEPPPRRSWSPPPQLPMFVGGGGGLGGADLFKDIH